MKSVANLTERDEVQLVNYLKGTNKERGLLINFGTSVKIKRKYKDFRPKSNLRNELMALFNLFPF